MTLLEHTFKRSEAQPPEGGIFLPENDSAKYRFRLWQHNLATQHDFTDATSSVLRVNEIVRSLRKDELSDLPLRCELLRGVLSTELEELRALIKQHTGTWDLAFSLPPLAPERAGATLRDNYEIETGDTRYQRIILPPGAVTAANVLEFNKSGNHYEPVIDLKIRTSADPTVLVFAEPKKVVEQVSEGTWFRFQLENVALRLPGGHDV